MTSSVISRDPALRIQVAQQHKGIYNTLKNCAMGDFHELFFLCVCLGHKRQKRSPLSKREDCFWSSTISVDEWYAYYALFIYDNQTDLSSLGDDKLVMTRMQEYANGGMEILIDEFLCDYLGKDSCGCYFVENTEQLPKELLMNIIDWSE